jgi:type II secretory pathway pseudopilin PulG
MRGKRSAEAGFTFIETLAGVAIMALVAGAVAPLAQGAMRSLGRMAVEERQLYDIAIVRDALASACERTREPLWAPSGALIDAGSGEAARKDWTIGYLDAEKDRTWTLRVEERRIAIENDGKAVAAGVDSARVATIVGDRRVIGLELSFEAIGRTWTWKEYFGAAGF